jgi:hypothetical protein
MDSAALLLPATGLAAFECPQLRKQQKPLLVPTGADAPAAGSTALVDVFQIDDLLDFSNEDIAGPIGTEADSLLAVNSCSSSLPAPVPSSAAAVQQQADLQAAAASCVEKPTAEQLHHHHHNSTAKPQQVEEEEEIEAHGMIEADLCVPYDDLEELEWASRFLDDSFPVATTGVVPDSSCCKGTWSMSDAGSVISIEENDCMENISAAFLFTKQQQQQKYEKATSPVSVLEQQTSATSSELTSTGSEHSLDHFCTAVTVPGRARSKRSRSSAGGKKWTSGMILSSTATTTTTTSCGTNEISIAPSQWSTGEDEEEEDDDDDDDDEDTVEDGEEWQSGNFFHKPKQSRKLSSGCQQQQQDHQGGAGDSAAVLRCRHCQTQRTPQWRTGPMGPKTLCNACGVRYKSGRLLPEYRPASSPAYIPHKHSNSHKKVLEMRRQRELMEA